MSARSRRQRSLEYDLDRLHSTALPMIGPMTMAKVSVLLDPERVD